MKFKPGITGVTKKLAIWPSRKMLQDDITTDKIKTKVEQCDHIIIDIPTNTKSILNIEYLIMAFANRNKNNKQWIYHPFMIEKDIENKIETLNKSAIKYNKNVIMFNTTETPPLIKDLIIDNDILIWDLHIVEKILTLGVYHTKYTQLHKINSLEQVNEKIRKDFQNKYKFSYKEYNDFKPYEIKHSHKRYKQNVLLNQILLTGYIYCQQKAITDQRGITNTIRTVEIPYQIVLMEINRHGCMISQKRSKYWYEKSGNELKSIKRELDKQNINIKEYINKHPINDLSDIYEWNLGDVEPVERTLIRKYLKCKNRRDTLRKLFDRCAKQDYKRINPKHVYMGAATGRNSCKNPSITSIGKENRSVVVAEDGYGIGEVDYCQAEIGVVAALTDCELLIKDYNNVDVYSKAAMYLFKDILPNDAKMLSPKKFKEKYPHFRNATKRVVLSVLYHIGFKQLAHDICEALKMGPVPDNIKTISVDDAKRYKKAFFDLYDGLEEGLDGLRTQGIENGYAIIEGGLRRYRGMDGELKLFEKRWMINTPIQGSAAYVFKIAGIRIRKAIKKYGGRIILPVHDSYVIEAPFGVLPKVMKEAKKIMEDTMREVFPALVGARAEVNADRPRCWNKEGEYIPEV